MGNSQTWKVVYETKHTLSDFFPHLKYKSQKKFFLVRYCNHTRTKNYHVIPKIIIMVVLNTFNLNLDLLINIAVMYRDTKLVVLNFGTYDVFSDIDEGVKHLPSEKKQKKSFRSMSDDVTTSNQR